MLIPPTLQRKSDCCRVILEPVTEGRLRLDAGTWGTMGVGLGYAIAAATVQPERLVVAVEGDSAFGFSGMEIETIARYFPCCDRNSADQDALHAACRNNKPSCMHHSVTY